jgi:hypothetical protein
MTLKASEMWPIGVTGPLGTTGPLVGTQGVTGPANSAVTLRNGWNKFVCLFNGVYYENR